MSAAFICVGQDTAHKNNNKGKGIPLTGREGP
jgi:hypothetical protein